MRASHEEASAAEIGGRVRDLSLPHRGQSFIPLFRVVPVFHLRSIDDFELQRSIEHLCNGFCDHIEVGRLLNMSGAVEILRSHADNETVVFNRDRNSRLESFPERSIVDPVFQKIDAIRPEGRQWDRVHKGIKLLL